VRTRYRCAPGERDMD